MKCDRKGCHGVAQLRVAVPLLGGLELAEELCGAHARERALTPSEGLTITAVR